MGMTYVEKILAKASGRSSTRPGDIVEPSIDLAMSHENGALVINQFIEIFKCTELKPNVWDPNRIAIIFDHRVPAESSKTATNHNKIRSFVKEQGIEKFHDVRGDKGGICHQILPENGYVRPGCVVVGTDSHTTTHGALGAFAFGIGATEMAAVWALGKALNIEVPETIKINLNGKLPDNVYPKDIILHLIGNISAEGANFKVLEFHGDAIKNIDTSGRLVISNMSMEAGATAGMFPPDKETVHYLKNVAAVREEIDIFGPDKDAQYCQTINIDISKLEPLVACPHMVDNVKPVMEVIDTKINQIVIGSCTNGRLDDLETAANILKGKKVFHETRMLIFPATWRIYKDALNAGFINTFIEAGAVVCNPGCGPCLGIHQGALGDGEKALATTNRNFKGRMGNPKAEVYLCSAAVAATSALTGTISDPRKVR